MLHGLQHQDTLHRLRVEPLETAVEQQNQAVHQGDARRWAHIVVEEVQVGIGPPLEFVLDRETAQGVDHGESIFVALPIFEVAVEVCGGCLASSYVLHLHPNPALVTALCSAAGATATL